jgi:hypothetical protein
MVCQKSLHETCRMGRRYVVMKLICCLSHCECDCHTVHKLSQRRLTVDWLAPWESDCSQMHNKVSTDWLPCYIKATWPVLEIFKMAGNFPYRPCTVPSLDCYAECYTELRTESGCCDHSSELGFAEFLDFVQCLILRKEGWTNYRNFILSVMCHYQSLLNWW